MVDEMDAYCIENNIDRKRFMESEVDRMKSHLDWANAEFRRIDRDNPEPG
jgi:serine/threonine-protein kinase RIO1